MHRVEYEDHVAGAIDPANLIADRYELQARLRQGVTRSFYRARDHATGAEVAVELLHTGELEVIADEAERLTSVDHPNVVQLRDHGRDHDRGFLVWELLDGRDFQTWLREDAPSSDEIVERFVAAGRGLAAAHQRGLVHGDVRGRHLFSTRGGRVVVLGWGLARSLDSWTGERDPRSPTTASLACVAPEQLAGQGHDAASDQWALSAALWEALLGTSPFTGDGPLSRYQSIRLGPTAGSSEGLDPQIIAALTRAMAFAPSDRFASIDAFLDALGSPHVEPRAATARRPVLTSLAVLGAFAIGWGLTPESPIVEEAHSTLDATTATALALLDSARAAALADDPTSAAQDLMYATELMAETSVGSENYCTFASAVPDLAELFLGRDQLAEARLGFAIAVNFAEHCPGLDVVELEFRQESAAARMRATPALSTPQG